MTESPLRGPEAGRGPEAAARAAGTPVRVEPPALAGARAPGTVRAEAAAPALFVDLDAIRQNTRSLVQHCREREIRVMAVTKAVCGLPAVAQAMLEGGAPELADSRLENLRRLRIAGITAPLWLLRLPQPSRVRETVELADGSLNSELTTLRALSSAALAAGRRHRVLLMVELGDRREGLLPEDVVSVARAVTGLPGLLLEGIGTNLTCFGGVCPTRENLGRLAALACQIEAATGLTMRTVSGGNSSSLPLLQEGALPPGINQLRLGEAILLGRETLHRRPLPGLRQDAFVLEAEAVELKVKPSLPEGEVVTDAFGQVPVFADRGFRPRAILALGRQDTVPEGLQPEDAEVEVLGGSSDHLLVDVGERPLSVGDRLRFYPSYGALLGAMTSPYVTKQFGPGRGMLSEGRWLNGCRN